MRVQLGSVLYMVLMLNLISAASQLVNLIPLLLKWCSLYYWVLLFMMLHYINMKGWFFVVLVADFV
jgi:hypothetical protein